MKKTTLLVFEDAVLVAVSAVLDLLIGTNRFLEQNGQTPAFDVELVGAGNRKVQLQQPAQFNCHRTLEEVDQTDLILIPSFIGEPDLIRQKYMNVVNWISRMHGNGAEVVSLCRGSYFLAESGLLNEKPCTSHWRAVEDMKMRYPQVNVMPDVIITEQDGVYTSGGAFSSIHIILYLVEKYCGRDVAIQVSKYFSIDMNRVSQAHFAVFRGQHDHGDEEIRRAQEWIEENFHRKISVDQIAAQTHMSRRNFIRRFKKATKNTPLEYLQRVKVEASKKVLEEGREPIGRLMYDVGYNDEKTFRKLFKRYTGLNPQEYRKRYSRPATGGVNELSGTN